MFYVEQPPSVVPSRDSRGRLSHIISSLARLFLPGASAGRSDGRARKTGPRLEPDFWNGIGPTFAKL